MMFKGVSPHQRKPKSTRTEKKCDTKPRQAQEVERLRLAVVDVQFRLRQAQELNSIYLAQINQLEDDNLALCARLQEVKIQAEATFRGFIHDKDQFIFQHNQLLTTISLLEKEIEVKNQENEELRAYLEQNKKNVEAAMAAELRSVDLEAEVERAKVKLLQSQKYWITRCQTLLEEQQAQNQRLLVEKETDFNLKIKHLSDQLTQRQQEVKEKTTEIYKLIGHIHSLAR